MERGPHGVGWSGGVWAPGQRVERWVEVQCGHDRHAQHQGQSGTFKDDGLADLVSVELANGQTAYVPTTCLTEVAS